MASVTPLQPPHQPRQAPPPAMEMHTIPQEQPFDPRRLLGALLRRKFMIAGLMVVGVAIALLHVSRLTPLYYTSATVLLQEANTNYLPVKGVASRFESDFYTNETQAAVIRSREIIGQVVDKLDLYNHPLFNSDLAPREASTFDVAKALLKNWTGIDLGTEDALEEAKKKPEDARIAEDDKETRARMREDLIDAFLGGLDVNPSQRALLIEIGYTSSDPAFAALAANTVAEVYILEQIKDKGNVTQKAAEFLAQRAAELRERVIDSEKRLEEFRRKSGIVEVQGENPMRAQLARLNADLIAARQAAAEATARYRQVQSLLKSGGGIETAASVLDSPLIQRLREQEAVLLRKLGELRTRLREAHPRMVLAQNELQDLRDAIAQEVNKIVVNLGNELQIARVRQQNLEAELARIENILEKQNEAAVTLRALTTEADANRQLYETIIARFKETNVVGDETQQADAKIISKAIEPGSPFYPQKQVMIVVALFFAGAIGVGLAILLELMDSGFRTTKQLEDMTGLPTIGAIPKLSRQDKGKLPHEVVSERPNSVFAEAVRSVRTALMLTGVDDDLPKTVVVTSSISGEGKTSVSLSMASLAARTGQRVIAVDCDVRRASLHQTLGVPNEIGLSNYLSGQAELDEIIDIHPTTGLHYITAGGRVPHPTELLGSQKMMGLLHTLSQTYDLVVLDTPPILAVSDALVLLRAVDRVIYVVRWEKTRRDQVLTAVKQVMDTGANLAGLVLSQVDVKKQGRYGYSFGYGNNNAYYFDNSKYFSD